MAINFIIKALNKDLFSQYLNKTDHELNAVGAQWLTADSHPGYPCRVSLADAKLGERVLALSFCHHDVNSPYKASGPIFVREEAETVSFKVNEVPTMLRHRLLSIRAYNSKGLMISADTVQGTALETVIQQQFQNSAVEYIHIHNAGPGCFVCSVQRL